MTVEIYDRDTMSWFDIAPYIALNGISFSRNDVDGPNAGRSMDGLMHRDRVSIKEKMQVQTIPLKQETVKKFHRLLEPETINVRVNPYPRDNGPKTFAMYSNNVKTSIVRMLPYGEVLQSLSFPLIEN